MKANCKSILLTALATSAAWILLLVIGFWLLIEFQPRSDERYILRGVTMPNHTDSAMALIVEQNDDPSSKAPDELVRIKIPSGERRIVSLRTVPYSVSATRSP